jgi:hypothetical protein
LHHHKGEKAANEAAEAVMPGARPVGDLQIDQDLTYQRWEWRTERAGWVLMGLVAAAGLLGLIGPGPLSQTTAGAEDGSLTVGYERFLHHHSPSQLRLRLAAGDSDVVGVRFPNSYLSQVKFEKVMPEPVEVRTEGADQTYWFRRTPGSALEVTVHFEPEERGRLHGAVGLVGGVALRFDQFVYP